MAHMASNVRKKQKQKKKEEKTDIKDRQKTVREGQIGDTEIEKQVGTNEKWCKRIDRKFLRDEKWNMFLNVYNVQNYFSSILSFKLT